MATKVESQRSGNRTSYVITGTNEAEVQAEIDRIIRNYHPLGYGTTFGEIKRQRGGGFIVRGHRYNTAD